MSARGAGTSVARGTVGGVTSTTSASPVGAPTGSPGRATDLLSGTRRLGPALGVIWLVFLAEPLAAALAAETPVRRGLGVAGVLGVAASFAGVCWHLQRRGRVGARTAVLVLVVQTACVVLSCVVVQEQGLMGLVFVCVTSVYFLPVAASLWLVGAGVVVQLALPRLLPGWEPADGNALVLVLAAATVYALVERLRRRREAQQQMADLAVARERERISRDMHDVLGHTLTVISVKAELAAKLLRAADLPDGSPAARAAAEVADLQGLARSALADVRGMVSGSRQVTLAGELAAARSALDAAGIAAELPGAVDEVPADRRELFAWVLREGTTNVLRHSGAARVVVTVDVDGLVVDDDGTGPAQDAPQDGEQDGERGGHGLDGLAARARAAGGLLESGPSPLGGYRLAVTVRPGAAVPGTSARIDA
ncbi:histidine kinase [Isoptericola cucumis]|uniref:Histidine kinase n=1 Tax=Isoptericola cucumis TaxID=1776856 RepID=A0ABQ2B6F7_9MICO|nr:histidine kinase [Isoptericola cucumis]